MDWSNIMSILLIIANIIILVAIIVVSEEKITQISYVQEEIPRFSVNVRFDEYPQTVNISNMYDCNANDVKKLRLCYTDNLESLVGCKELTVKCQHFAKDTKLMHNGERKCIPANKAPNEGWALAIPITAEDCNTEHGDWTLVTLDASSNEYMMVCSCKNPGYIGNQHLLGNCTTPFICDGQIEGSIDKPLKDIKCKCSSKTQISVNYDDGLPVCKELTVIEANELYDEPGNRDWSHLVPFGDKHQLNIVHFNKTIAGNLHTTRLLDPCKYSFHDTRFEIPNGRFDPTYRECRFKDYGYPLTGENISDEDPDNPIEGLLDFNKTLIKTKNKGDEKEITEVAVFGALATKQYEKIRYADNIGGVRRIYGIIVNGISFHKGLENMPLVLQPRAGISFGGFGVINITSKENNFVKPKCQGRWPTYYCYFKNDFRKYFNELPYPNARLCPSDFLWKKDGWNNAEFIIENGARYTQRGITFTNTVMQKVPVEPYGLQFVKKDSPEDNGLLTFNNSRDYTQVHELITHD